MIGKAAALLVLACIWGVPAGALTLDFPVPAQQTAQRQEPLGSYALPVGPATDGKVKTLAVEGPVVRTAWRLPQKGLTTLPLFAALRQQVKADGYDLIYECDTEACGGFDFRYGFEVLGEPAMHVDLGDFRYLAARRGGGGGTAYVALLVSRSADAGFVELVQVGGDSVPGDEARSGPAPVTQPHLDNTAESAAEAVAAPAAPDAAQAASAQPTARTQDAQQQAGDAQPTADAIGAALQDDGSTVLEGLRFASGSSDLAEGDYPSLAALADWLKADPARKVTLVGHTDAVGALDANIALSKRRAASVLDRLVKRYGVGRDQLDAEGVGFLAPRASNQTDAGRRQNRRVEVVLNGAG